MVFPVLGFRVLGSGFGVPFHSFLRGARDFGVQDLAAGFFGNRWPKVEGLGVSESPLEAAGDNTGSWASLPKPRTLNLEP